jgi:hypothetical protein
MYAAKLPEAWEIAEMDRMRRIRDTDVGQGVPLPLPLPPPPPRQRRDVDVDDEPGARSVIVIDLC